MPNLYWKTRTGTRKLVDRPFPVEEVFEKTIFETADLLEDVFPLKRQVRGGGKSGIPDIIGVDPDGNVCIVEVKNVAVGPEIIPQVLQYAVWAETNPDSIKSLWLECKDRPEDITITWDSMQVRIIVVAPQIRRATLMVADKINYQVDLVEINRWIDGEDELYFVNRLEPEAKSKPARPVSGTEIYDEKFYRETYSPKTAELFFRIADEMQALVEKNNWNVERKFNKHYCGFKAGAFNAFGLKWISAKTLSLFFKLSEAEALATGIAITRYEKGWKEAYLYVDPDKIVVAKLEPLFRAAYEKLLGE